MIVSSNRLFQDLLQFQTKWLYILCFSWKSYTLNKIYRLSVQCIHILLCVSYDRASQTVQLHLAKQSKNENWLKEKKEFLGIRQTSCSLVRLINGKRFFLWGIFNALLRIASILIRETQRKRDNWKYTSKTCIWNDHLLSICWKTMLKYIRNCCNLNYFHI